MTSNSNSEAGGRLIRSRHSQLVADPLMREAWDRQRRRRHLLTVAGLILLAGVAAYLLFGRSGGTSDGGSGGSAPAAQPTLAQMEAAIASHSDNFILANTYSFNGLAVGHGWIDLKTGAGRWASPGEVELQTVRRRPHEPTQVIVSQTIVNVKARTWYRTSREESIKLLPAFSVVDPLASNTSLRLRVVGVETVDGRQSYHLRSSSYAPYLDATEARLDVWLSTAREYLIRIRRTTKQGKVIERTDNRWLPRTPANLALTSATIPSGFKRVPAPFRLK